MKNTTTIKRETIVINGKARQLTPDLVWVLRARVKDSSREVLQYMNKDSKGICCTDGRRLHLFTALDLLPALADGLWDVKISKDQIIFIPIDNGLQFPDYNAIMPKYNDKAPLKIDLSEKDVTESTYAVTLVNIAIKKQAGLGCINVAFLYDMKGYVWEVSAADQAPETKVLLFTSGSCLGLIMPIKL